VGRFSRRELLTGAVAAVGALSPVATSGQNAQTPTAAPSPVPAFGFDAVIQRAQTLASAPFDASIPPLPDPVAAISPDTWRQIRFKSDGSLLGAADSAFRLELFHLGGAYKRPVIVNILREGAPTPIPYTAALFDLGSLKIAGPLPVNLGFAGLKLLSPLNAPHVFEETLAFLGGAEFRFISRGQREGLAAEALGAPGAANGADPTPFFREFWIETPAAGAESATVYGLLDSPVIAGAFRFELWPGAETRVEVTANLFARDAAPELRLAPLASMFLVGRNDVRAVDDYRSEVHLSDGLLMHNGAGEWIWRPLSNPQAPAVSTFIDSNPRGYGLMQRDRVFDDYQDLEQDYELKPSYWIEPGQGWGEGRIELNERPTKTEAGMNVSASWVAKEPLAKGAALTYGYRISSLSNEARLNPAGRTVDTFLAKTPGSGGARFLIDFGGGDLSYFASDPSLVSAVATSSTGAVLPTTIAPNSHARGFRATIDAPSAAGQAADIRVYLRVGNKALTETWTFPLRG